MNKIILLLCILTLTACTSLPSETDSNFSSSHEKISKRELKLSHKACNSDYTRGYCATLGIWYEEGIKVNKDYKMASMLYKKDCDRIEGGFGCYRLGRLFGFADNPNRDEVKSKKHYQLGCEKGSSEACAQFAILDSQRHDSYLSNNSQKDGVMVSKTGLQYEAMNLGEGTLKPSLQGDLLLNVKSTLSNGKAFFSSNIHVRNLKNIPIPALVGVIKNMRVGDRYRFHIAPHLRSNLPRYDKEWINLHKVPLTEIVIVDIELLDVKPEMWVFEQTKYGAKASIERVDYSLKKGVLDSRGRQAFYIEYNRNIGDLGDWEYWTTIAPYKNSYASRQPITMLRIQKNDDEMKSFNSFDDELLISMMTTEPVDEYKLVANHYIKFELEGFSVALKKVQQNAAEYAATVNTYGPLLKYKRLTSEFTLPVESQDCTLDEEKLTYHVPLYKLAHVDSYFEEKKDEQEKCLFKGIKKNYEAIEKLVLSIDGQWSHQIRVDNVEVPLWSIPAGCSSCSQKVRAVVGKAQNLVINAVNAMNEADRVWQEIRPQVVGIVKSNISRKESLANSQRRKKQIERANKISEDKLYRKWLKNQPSELDSFARNINDTAKNVERKIKQKEKKELDKLIFEAELNQNLKKKSSEDDSNATNFHLKSQCANKNGQRTSDSNGKVCRWSCPKNGCDCKKVCTPVSKNKSQKAAGKSPDVSCPVNHCLYTEPKTGMKTCKLKRDKEAKCHVVK